MSSRTMHNFGSGEPELFYITMFVLNVHRDNEETNRNREIKRYCYKMEIFGSLVPCLHGLWKRKGIEMAD